MGYTIYYQLKKRINKEDFQNIINNSFKALKIIKKNYKKIQIAEQIYNRKDIEVYCQQTDKKIYKSDEIFVNGNLHKELEHETFSLIPNDLNWNFCKTARNPYSLFVFIVLLLIKDFDEYSIDFSWDGNQTDINWLYHKLVKYNFIKNIDLQNDYNI